ncbi:hypothetical protein L873DRAFT_1848443 [Choiromyces venosus 120613-1]|uniref:Uncharacterized protein n=1 Tax=Choiromyces venosus 120613-1 TaxID=1336337 RepID=A0A3N4J1M6_9PEZI|nr:hypothetical protein L873DRAFT_1848443 [Choiromyces venosus 120613-1]
MTLHTGIVNTKIWYRDKTTLKYHDTVLYIVAYPRPGNRAAAFPPSLLSSSFFRSFPPGKQTTHSILSLSQSPTSAAVALLLPLELEMITTANHQLLYSLKAVEPPPPEVHTLRPCPPAWYKEKREKEKQNGLYEYSTVLYCTHAGLPSQEHFQFNWSNSVIVLISSIPPSTIPPSTIHPSTIHPSSQSASQSVIPTTATGSSALPYILLNSKASNK